MTSSEPRKIKSACKSFIAPIALLQLAGCAGLKGSFDHNYLYEPTEVQRGLKEKIVIGGKDTEHNLADGIPLSDTVPVTIANDVKQAWKRREQAVLGLNVGAGIAQGGLQAIAGLTNLPSAIAALAPQAAKWIGIVTGVVDPNNSTIAYEQGAAMLSNALVEFYDNFGIVEVKDVTDDTAATKISGKVLTKAGALLFRRIAGATITVDNAISQRITRLTDLQNATAGMPPPARRESAPEPEQLGGPQ